MNMIKINFIPGDQRRQKTDVMTSGIGGVPVEVLFGIVVAFIGTLFLAHAVLFSLALTKLAGYKILQSKWAAMAPQKKVFDDIEAENKAIQARLSSLSTVTSQGKIVWARLLNDISDSVPKGIWLIKLTYSSTGLLIEGGSVSKIRNEMVSAGSFVSALRGKQSIQDYFTSVDVDSIQRRPDSALSIADFTLKGKQK